MSSLVLATSIAYILIAVLAVKRQLDPDDDYDDIQSRFAERGGPRSFGNAQSTSLTAVRRRHPWACLGSKRIHRQLFLVAETDAAYQGKDLSIYKADWDGNLSGIRWDEQANDVRREDRDKLFAIEPEVEFVEHVHASRALERLDALSAEQK